MKPSRDEVLRVAKECGLRFVETPPESYSTIGAYLWGEPVDVERFAAAMYAKGAEAERAMSDRLLDALKMISDNGPSDDMDGSYIIADEAIAEVEAMRQERKEKPE